LGFSGVSLRSAGEQYRCRDCPQDCRQFHAYAPWHRAADTVNATWTLEWESTTISGAAPAAAGTGTIDPEAVGGGFRTAEIVQRTRLQPGVDASIPNSCSAAAIVEQLPNRHACVVPTRPSSGTGRRREALRRWDAFLL